MPALTQKAEAILSRMEPGLAYGPSDLRPLAPGESNETLRELMHELWVNRCVERVGYAGWRLSHSTAAADPPVSAPPKTVKPEDLFDHDRFSGFFK